MAACSRPSVAEGDGDADVDEEDERHHYREGEVEGVPVPEEAPEREKQGALLAEPPVPAAEREDPVARRSVEPGSVEGGAEVAGVAAPREIESDGEGEGVEKPAGRLGLGHLGERLTGW